MRWPGTIQPSRFLSHTGLVLPGVRRVVQVPNPAAGEDWTVTVPAGVQWRIASGVATLTTSATVGGRGISSVVSVGDVQIFNSGTFVTITAGVADVFLITDPLTAINYVLNADFALPALTGDFLPQGATYGPSVDTLDAADQWSAISLWIEEVYVTDPQLSEDARLHAELERDIAVYEYEQAEQTGGAP